MTAEARKNHRSIFMVLRKIVLSWLSHKILSNDGRNRKDRKYRDGGRSEGSQKLCGRSYLLTVEYRKDRKTSWRRKIVRSAERSLWWWLNIVPNDGRGPQGSRRSYSWQKILRQQHVVNDCRECFPQPTFCEHPFFRSCAPRAQIVDFLVDPSAYDSLGASRPKGILLVGPPGTG